MDATLIFKLGCWLVGLLDKLIPLVLASFIALWAFFRQREYETIKKRYLEDGVDKVASEMSKNINTLRHNWTRAIRLLEEYRSYGDAFDLEELKKDYLDVHGGNLENIANQRVHYLTDSIVFWDAFQSSLAFCKSSDDFMKKEVSKVFNMSLSDDGEHIDKDEVIKAVENKLMEINRKIKPYDRVVSELVSIGQVLERQKFKFKDLQNFHKIDIVKSAIGHAEQANNSCNTQT